ncbi:putative exo-beta-1,3-glucanase [Basidiobolus meristosporus CBS 931.73]|uniref:Putative exo-beta-1,3-glucanase n=1 Tax=Basidiobolus meristosporus CBS 931.73 TaxID=1314790 RepID=A0A1Y1YVX6_9FUNG|nr:putative exo-beta-1,3-glucanase [Basidiobolus meristosporus CBS 931.73]|eukprot:ORY02208.1 putative exo-beta-1,3-glucanase [Basidiobolus meristosporus CBS 931.73]
MKIAYFTLITVLKLGASLAAPLPDKIRGVNLGGWLLIEPWITPSLFEQFLGKPNAAVDEFTFCQYLGKSEAYRQLQLHWGTWVTEVDFQKLANYGLNTVRIPYGYWMVDSREDEPYVQGQYPYLRQAVNWAIKYNMHVLLDLHGAPNSQNGFDNSGRVGSIDWPKDPQNIQRTVNVLANVTAEFKNEIEGGNVSIQFLNEPFGVPNTGITLQVLQDFYGQAYTAIHQATGLGYQPLIVGHDGFSFFNEMGQFLSTMQNTVLDTHIYQVFDENLLKFSQQQHLDMACGEKQKMGNSPIRTVVGEWSLATTDCTPWLNGFQKGARYDGTYLTSSPVCPGCTCKDEGNVSTFNSAYRVFLRQYAEKQMDAYEASYGWIFWNFKAENAPQWNYIQGVEEGWIPNPPTNRLDRC